MKNLVKKVLTAGFVLGLLITVGGQSAFAASAPTILTATPSNITSSSATFGGVVNPNGANTNAWYEFEVANSGQLSFQSVGSDATTHTLSGYTATGLTSNTTYRFRIVANNSVGYTFHSWTTFTTAPGNSNPGTGDNTPTNPTGPTGSGQAPIIKYFTASPTEIYVGETTTISWSVSGADSCSGISQPTTAFTGFNKPFTGTQTLVLNTATTYYFTLNCINAAGSTSLPAIVHVKNMPQQEAPNVTLTANPSTIQQGQSSTLTWTVQNATSCVASNGWSGTKNSNSGSEVVTPIVTTRYNLNCTGPGGTTQAFAIVTVTQAPQQNAPIVTLTANPNSVVYGGSTTLTWTVQNATSCTASSNPQTSWTGAKSTSGGSQTVTGLTSTTYFNLYCSGPGGSDSATVAVTVGTQQVNLPTINITANPISVVYDGSTILTWNSTNATSCTAFSSPTNSQWNGAKALSGSMQISNLRTTTTFSITCTNSAGQDATDHVTVTVGNIQNQNTPNVTTYPASNITETSATLNGFVEPNGSFATRWFEWGTSYSALYNTTNRVNQGTSASNVSDQIYGLNSNTTYYYRVVAQNQTGTSYGNVVTFTTTSRVIIDSCFTGSCAPSVVTTQASSVTSRSARLNGVAFVNGNVQTQGYFEYGTSQALGFTTPVVNLGAGQSIPMFSTIAPLSPSTTYYFRAVATNQFGTARGSILSFRTGSAGTVGTVAGVTTQANPYLTYRETTLVTNSLATGVSKPSLVFLDTNCGSQVLRPGDILECTVYWKNVSSRNLNQVLLRTGFPQELEFIKATAGNFSPVDNAVVVEIGNLAPGQEGSMTFTTQVRTDAELGKIIVVASNLVYTYTGDNGALNQEEVFSYSDHLIQDGTKVLGLSGNALFSGVFLPTSLLGWLLLLLLILLILLALRMAYNNMRPTTVVNVPPHTHTTTTL